LPLLSVHILALGQHVVPMQVPLPAGQHSAAGPDPQIVVPGEQQPVGVQVSLDPQHSGKPMVVWQTWAFAQQTGCPNGLAAHDCPFGQHEVEKLEPVNVTHTWGADSQHTLVGVVFTVKLKQVWPEGQQMARPLLSVHAEVAGQQAPPMQKSVGPQQVLAPLLSVHTCAAGQHAPATQAPEQQEPLQQDWPLAHVFPHFPQLVTVLRSAHAPLQHPWPGAQTWLQLPQLVVVVMSVQVPEQQVWLFPQEVPSGWGAQVPPPHEEQVPHVFPHAPQLETLVLLTHVPPQQICWEPQPVLSGRLAPVQVPFWQV
jgi:hypothetical protein